MNTYPYPLLNLHIHSQDGPTIYIFERTNNDIADQR